MLSLSILAPLAFSICASANFVCSFGMCFKNAFALTHANYMTQVYAASLRMCVFADSIPNSQSPWTIDNSFPNISVKTEHKPRKEEREKERDRKSNWTITSTHILFIFFPCQCHSLFEAALTLNREDWMDWQENPILHLKKQLF